MNCAEQQNGVCLYPLGHPEVNDNTHHLTSKITIRDDAGINFLRTLRHIFEALKNGLKEVMK